MPPSFQMANAFISMQVQGAGQVAATLASATAAARAAQQAVAIPLMPAGQAPGTTAAARAGQAATIPLASAPSGTVPLMPAGTMPGKAAPAPAAAPAAPAAGAGGLPVPLPVFDVAVWAALKTLQGFMKPGGFPAGPPLPTPGAIKGDIAGDLGKAASAVTALATQGFGRLTGSVQSFLQAASPAHWDTLTGSINLVSARLGQAFLPYLESAIGFVQDLGNTIRDMDDATKDTVARWIMLGGAILGALVLAPRVIALGAAIYGVAAAAVALAAGVTGLGAGSAIASTGFYALGASIRTATAAVVGFLATNPIGWLLLLGAAVGALALGFGGAADSIADLAQRFEQLRDIREALEGGGELNRRQLETVFAPEQREALQSARTPEARRTAARGIVAEEQGQQRERGQTGEQVRTEANRAEQLAAHARANPEGFGQLPMAIQAAMQARSEGMSPAAAARLAAGLQANQTPAQIAAAIRQPFEQSAARIVAAQRVVQTGEVPGGAQPRGPLQHDIRFQAQIGDVTTAWRRLQQAANSMSPLQQETMRIQIQSMESLLRQEAVQREIRDRLPGGPGQPGPPPIPPVNFGGGPG